jgi:hypothetical protein
VGFDTIPPHEPWNQQLMQRRLRAGLTGLACVFLIVLLAAAILNLAREKDAAGGTAGNQMGNGAIAADPPKDPLAELGVAPDAAPDPAPPAPTPKKPAPTR